MMQSVMIPNETVDVAREGSFEIYRLCNPFEVRGADEATLRFIAVFFVKYVFLPT